MSLLNLENLSVAVGTQEILKGIDFAVSPGEVHVIMGPNGSGKSTLAQTIVGNTQYQVTDGSIELFGKEAGNTTPDQRARAGLFLSFQHPVAIPGLPLFNFLYTAYTAQLAGEGDILDEQKKLSVNDFYRTRMLPPMTWLDVPEEMIQRGVNDELSGGERKKTEVLQLAVLEPKLAIIDELDAGLDVDALKMVFAAVNRVFEQRKDTMGLIIITHNQKVLDYITPTMVHVMMDGSIVASGGPEIAQILETEGYKGING
ncbi:MAG: Fe-S cluster assembly ATPase SufC [Patescibacteria group bacterium]